ncbi:MAG: amidohydrolase family protein, partial [Firmicutes bacterium]|nr:amidohydrolase family protein [Bacillota bacterium]
APVLLHRTCAHVICVNSKALEIAGITAETPDPEGGQIDRDEKGEPTGVLRETAKNLIEPFLPVPSHDELVQQIVDLGKILEKQGVVAVSDMGLFDSTDTYGLLSDAAKAGFAQRTAVYYMWNYFFEHPPVVTDEMKDHKNQIFVAGVKTVGDGSISGRTAWVYEPFLGGNDSGICVCSDEVLESAIKFAKENKLQLSMHAMGGRAIDRVIKRFESEQSWLAGGSFDAGARAEAIPPHLRLEHLTEPTEYSIGEAIKKGYAFVTQPIFQYSEIESYLVNMGLERTRRAYPIRTMLESGVNLALSTDAPATSWATPSDPLPNIKAAVTRVAYDGTDYGPGGTYGEDQRISVEEAIYLYTRAGALILGMNDSGRLHKGALADFLVLSEDIFTVPTERIDKIKIETHMHNA